MRTKRQIMDDLQHQSMVVEQHQARLNELVIEAREGSVSWAHVGACIGTSPQTAYNRYHHLGQETLVVKSKRRGRR